MPKITTQTMKAVEHEVTPDFCFSRAADALATTTINGMRDVETAREWRALGEAIASYERP